MMNEPIMENKQSRKKLPDLTILICGTTANRKRQIFAVCNKIQKKVCSSVHLSAGPQTCPDFKMERQMSVTNSQYMEWTHREIYRKLGSGSFIRSLKYKPGLWAIIRCALSSLARGGTKQLVVTLPLALQLICSEWLLSQTPGKPKTQTKMEGLSISFHPQTLVASKRHLDVYSFSQDSTFIWKTVMSKCTGKNEITSTKQFKFIL